MKLEEFSHDLIERYGFNRKILLVQLPQFMFNAFNPKIIKARGAYIWPPVGIQWLSNILDGRGLDIKLFDLNFHILKQVQENPDFKLEDWKKLLDQELDEFQPTVVGVSTINISAAPDNEDYPLRATLDYLKSRDRYIVLAGGPNAGNDAAYFLENELAHCVVKGEADIRVPRLFDYLEGQPTAIAPQSGILFQKNGQVFEDGESFQPVAPKGNVIKSYDQVPVEAYCQYGSLNPFSRMVGADRPFATIQLNRGCRADCEFCGVTEFMGGRGIRALPADDVAAEVDYLVKERSIRHFELLDDDFLGKRSDRDNLISFLKRLVYLKRDYDISWSAGNGLIASSLDEELMDLIGQSGCIGFRIGIESGNDEMIRKMRKPASLNSLLESSVLFKKYPEIMIGGNFILGIFGEETFSQMLDTYNFSKKMGLDWAGYTVFQFTHTSETKEKKKKTFGASDFVPSKDASNREIGEKEGILSGINVFDLPRNQVPSREQVRHIWQTFNLVSNYIDNKNLKPGGDADKYLRWLEAVFKGYPDNVYMPLFISLAQTLTGDENQAKLFLERTRENYDASPLWQQFFEDFGLVSFLEEPVKTPDEVYDRLGEISDKIERKTGN